jgi:muramoyltetrapeptide carboxypeptidase
VHKRLVRYASDCMSFSKSSRVKPPALQPADTVGIVAPASNVNRADLEAGCEALRRAGYRPFYFDSILDQDLYFAGSVERRARELEAMFARSDVKAIVCARGGYGSNYLLETLDLEKIKAHPKIFVGYSDLTTLLTYFSDTTGLVTFHGPLVAKDWAHADGVDLASWQSALSGSAAWELNLGASSGVTGLVEGAAEGILYGGCLSILVASLGTPYEIETAGTILFLEDLAEKPYQIDRMLMQLKLAGKLKSVRGIVFGEMHDCVANRESRLHARRCHIADRRQAGSSNCLRRPLRTRDGRQYDPADRRPERFDGARWRSKLERFWKQQ